MVNLEEIKKEAKKILEDGKVKYINGRTHLCEKSGRH